MDEIARFAVTALLIAAKAVIATILYCIFIIILGGIMKVSIAVAKWGYKKIDDKMNNVIDGQYATGS